MYPEPELCQPCSDNEGVLPSCAPLAVPYVPYQQMGCKRYTQLDALANGTLYPGLNLPFRLKSTATPVTSTHMSELQALEFVVLELALYLDTHPEDSEAFELFRQYTTMEQATRADYVAKHGPLYREDAAMDETYTWIRDPFPWNGPMEG